MVILTQIFIKDIAIKLFNLITKKLNKYDKLEY